MVGFIWDYILDNYQFYIHYKKRSELINSVKYTFRLIGIPPEEAMKTIEIDDNLTVGEVKKIIMKEFKLTSGEYELILK